MRNDFEQIYTGLSEMGFVISINTNGSLLSGKIAELFKKLPPNRLNISLYGVSDKTYREVTGRAAFESVKNNILDMRASGIDCRINCSLTPLNAAEINGIFLLTETGAFLWKLIESGTPENELANKLTEEFDVPPETAQKDLDNFIKKLTNLKILTSE